MACLQGIYKAFLASPNGAALNDEASLNYITTLTTIHPAPAVVKHFAALEKVLKKKEEKSLNAIESDNALCLEVETTIEFISGGGAYLPGLDNEFLTDRIVTFPVIHIVQFDANQKIQSVRLSWDQGSLLKQVDVIGARARSWPIRDGKDQARLINSSAVAAQRSNGAQDSARAPSKSTKTQATASSDGGRSRKESIANRDPHASLSLFEDNGKQNASNGSAIAPKGSAKPPPRDYDIFGGDEVAPRQASPRKENQNPGTKAQSAKPPPRDYQDLFAGAEEDASPASKAKMSSPLKNVISPRAPKAGAGKNFQPMRLFDNLPDDVRDSPKEPKPAGPKYMKPNPTKYNHFEFGQNDDNAGEDQKQQAVPNRPKSSKHQSQWGFEDFMTPNKVTQKPRTQDQRNFGWSDDEPNMDSPPKKAPPKPRPDANPHFEYVDDGTPAGERRPAGHPRGTGGNPQNGTGLYKNHLFDSGETDSADRQGSGRPLSTVPNPKEPRKDMNSQFGMTDAPTPDNGPAKQFPGHKSAAIQTMSANWSASDTSPAPAHSDRTSSNHPFGTTTRKGKENFPTAAGHKNIGIMSAGDGMGGKKGSGRAWGFGDDSDGEEIGGQNTGRFQAQRRQQAPAESNEWDF